MRLMLVPGMGDSLADAEAAIDAIQLAARRRGAAVASDSLAASAAASAGMDGSDPVIAASLLMDLESMRLRDGLLQALARMDVIAGVERPLEDRGRPRSDFESSERLSALAEAMSTSTAPAFLVAAVAHAELLDMRPFASNNGVIARSAWRGIMIQSGLEPTGLVMHEVGLRDLGRAAYEQALQQYQSGSPAGVAAWVAHCSRATQLGVAALKELLQRS